MLTKIRHVEPPVMPEIELRTLAALINLGESNDLRVQQAMLLLDKDCFSNADTRQIYQVIRDLINAGEKINFIDFVTHAPDHLYPKVHSLVREEYMFSNTLEHDVKKLTTVRAWRNQIKILVDAVNGSFDCLTPEESLDKITEIVQGLSQSSSTTRKSYSRTYETIANDFLFENNADDTQVHVDIPGLPPVPNRALITIAGRSGHGKTFFALHLMDKLIDAMPGKQTLYFNLEMDERVMMERHATLIGVRGISRKERIGNGVGLLLPKNVSLISEPMITIEEIETECRLASMRKPLAVIVVDYLGLIRSKNRSESKHLEQNDIAKRLAALSLELDCRVIALIQVNREFKTRTVGDRCPVTSDAADSMGSVHSSSWWLGIDQPQADSDDPEWRDQFMISCRKNRGEAGLFSLKLKFKYGMFSKWERPFSTPSRITPSGF